MELDQQQQQKGLFTFYREQADLEDQLQLKRRFLKQAKAQKMEENGRRLFNNSKNYHHIQKQPFPSNEDHQQKKADGNKKLTEPRDKLIGILRKYNGKQIKRRQNLKIILESQQQIPFQNTSQLKNRLQLLQEGEQKLGQFKLGMAQKLSEQKFKLQFFGNKRQVMPKINPFQRLAIIPTNFKNHFENQLPLQIPKKKSLSRQRGMANNNESKKQKCDGDLRQNDRYQLKNIKDLMDSKRPNLPRLEGRANSQVIDRRKKIKLEKIGEKSMQQVQTERLGKKPQLSLLLESIKLTTESSSTKIGQNKIYSLFIQNKQPRRHEETNRKHKEIILSDVLKKLKFS